MSFKRWDKQAMASWEITKKMGQLVPDLEQHPLGMVWKPFDEEAFEGLKADVAERGLDEPVVIYEGKVLDGWNRYKACKQARRSLNWTVFEGTDLEAAERVIGTGKRRTVSAQQRYAVFLMMCDTCPAYKEKYAADKAVGEDRMKSGKPLGPGEKRVDVLLEKARQAAVSRSTAYNVEKAVKANPKALEAIAKGVATAESIIAAANRGVKVPRSPTLDVVRQPSSGDKKGKKSSKSDKSQKAKMIQRRATLHIDLTFSVPEEVTDEDVRSYLMLITADCKAPVTIGGTTVVEVTVVE